MSKATFVRTVCQELSCALRWDNAGIYPNFCCTWGWKEFVPGLERAVGEAGDFEFMPSLDCDSFVQGVFVFSSFLTSVWCRLS